jgi:hypothetical protein
VLTAAPSLPTCPKQRCAGMPGLLRSCGDGADRLCHLQLGRCCGMLPHVPAGMDAARCNPPPAAAGPSLPGRPFPLGSPCNSDQVCTAARDVNCMPHRHLCPNHAAGCPWLPLAAPGCPWLPLAAPGCPWLPLAAPGCPSCTHVARTQGCGLAYGRLMLPASHLPTTVSACSHGQWLAFTRPFAGLHSQRQQQQQHRCQTRHSAGRCSQGAAAAAGGAVGGAGGCAAGRLLRALASRGGRACCCRAAAGSDANADKGCHSRAAARRVVRGVLRRAGGHELARIEHRHQGGDVVGIHLRGSAAEGV